MRENQREENWEKSPSFRCFGARFLMQFLLVSLPLICRSSKEWKWQWILGVLIHKLRLNKSSISNETFKEFSILWLWDWLEKLGQGPPSILRQWQCIYKSSIWFPHHFKFDPKIEIQSCISARACVKAQIMIVIHSNLFQNATEVITWVHTKLYINWSSKVTKLRHKQNPLASESILIQIKWYWVLWKSTTIRNKFDLGTFSIWILEHGECWPWSWKNWTYFGIFYVKSKMNPFSSLNNF